ncbi:MAG: condensation domain-containing protein [Cellvibrio sp.]
MSITSASLTPVKFSESEPIRQSFAQNRLWFLYQMDPQNGQHNIVFRLVVDGPALDKKRLTAAFNKLVWRHKILRTGYSTTETGSVQKLVSNLTIPLEVINFSETDPENENSLITAWLQAEQKKPFDLSSGKVIRTYLLKRRNNLQEIIYTIHHIAFDGRSNEIFRTELSELYSQTFGGQENIDGEEINSLEDIASPDYADFSVWERNYLTADIIQSDLDFWRDHLHNFPQQLNFKDRSDNGYAVKTENFRFFISNEIADNFKRSAKQQKQTLFNALTTLFNLWIYHISGQDRFLIGTDVHGRDFPELANIMGFFVNQLIIKCDLSNDPTLKEFLAGTRTSIKHSLAHHQVPFDVLVSSLAPERSLHRPPFFQVKFNYRPYRFIVDRIGESQIIESQIINGLAGFDLLLDLMEGKHGIEVNLQYNQHLFTATDIQCFASGWLNLLTHFETLIDAPISEIDQQLSRWGDTYLQGLQQSHSQQNRARLKNSSRKILSF